MTQEESIAIFKCLADRSRLSILSGLMKGDAYAELIAQRLSLTPSTVSFHMKKLEEAGLVTSRKDQYYTVYSLNRAILDQTLIALVCPDAVAEDAQQRREEEYRSKVIKAFFEYGRLKQIPAQRKKKLICYEQIIKRFELGRIYEEKELSAILAEYNEDYCTLRRDMISEGLLKREGTQYERLR